MAACGGGSGGRDATSGGGGSGVGGVGGSGVGGSGVGGSGVGGNDPPIFYDGTLVDVGLLARYFIDEAGQGQGPSQLIDAAADPLNLTLSYVNAMGP